MKKILPLIFLGLLSAASAEFRTWTSASDPTKTFEAQFKSADGDTITLLRKNRRIQKIKLSLLSQADQDWIKEKAEKPEEALGTSGLSAEEFANSDFGKSLKKIQKLDGRKFKRSPIEAVPKFFILYYSASW